jgi:hypothetical protein
MKITLTELRTLIKNIINEEKIDLISFGFQKWGDGFLMRLPKGTSASNDAIRITAEYSSTDESVFETTISVQSNKKVRSEIKGITTFKNIESILKSNFSISNADRNWENVSGTVDLNNLKKIITMLSSLKVDEKNNWFTL